MSHATDLGLFNRASIACDGASKLNKSKPKAADDSGASDVGLSDTSWMTVINPDRRRLAEADVIRSLYEGVPYSTGLKREREFRLQKAMKKGAVSND
jgi:hypothetical protein